MKHVLVIGGGGGLGGALVGELQRQGIAVSVAGRTPPANPHVLGFHTIDAASADWAKLLASLESLAPPVDGIIFVAGTGAFGETAAIPEEKARATFELNFWGCTRAALAAAAHWSAAKRPGKFLAVLSIAGKRAVPWESYYAASKAATARFLDCLQLEYIERGIEFISVFPGLLKTPFRENVSWYGMTPTAAGEGADLTKTANAMVRILLGKRSQRVLGWRERMIDWADRIWPGLYDRLVLRKRMRSQRDAGQ